MLVPLLTGVKGPQALLEVVWSVCSAAVRCEQHLSCDDVTVDPPLNHTAGADPLSGPRRSALLLGQDTIKVSEASQRRREGTLLGNFVPVVKS